MVNHGGKIFRKNIVEGKINSRGTLLFQEGGSVGKKKVISEEEIKDMVLPVANDMLGIVARLLGFYRVLVKCQDSYERICQIRGNMKRRVWIREGNVVLVSPWDFQSNTRGDVTWRYTKGQIDLLRKNGLLTL